MANSSGDLATHIGLRPYVVALDNSSMPAPHVTCDAMREIADAMGRMPLELVAIGYEAKILIDAPTRDELINLDFQIEIVGGSLVGPLGDYLVARGYTSDTAVVLVSDGYCMVDRKLPFELILFSYFANSGVRKQFDKVFDMGMVA